MRYLVLFIGQGTVQDFVEFPTQEEAIEAMEEWDRGDGISQCLTVEGEATIKFAAFR